MMDKSVRVLFAMGSVWLIVVGLWIVRHGRDVERMERRVDEIEAIALTNDLRCRLHRGHIVPADYVKRGLRWYPSYIERSKKENSHE